MRIPPSTLPFLIAFGLACVWPSSANAQRRPDRAPHAHHEPPPPMHGAVARHAPARASHEEIAHSRLIHLENDLHRAEALARAFHAPNALHDLGVARGELMQARHVVRARGPVWDFERWADAAERRIRSAENEVRREERALRRLHREAADAVAELGRLRVDGRSGWDRSHIDHAYRSLADGEYALARDDMHRARWLFEETLRAASSVSPDGLRGGFDRARPDRDRRGHRRGRR
jgi:hypothetical protein